MAWTDKTVDQIRHLNLAKRRLGARFTDREKAVDLLALATVCHEHLLLVGPPGTAKTQIIQQYTNLLDTTAFQYLLTRFTEPSELFGPLDLKQFSSGTYHIRTENMLPEADVVFLDEVFQGGSAILNSLLAILNERVFYNGSLRQPVPLISLIGACNVIPDDVSLQAFADRFVLRLQIQPVSDEHIDNLLDAGWMLEVDRIKDTIRAAAGKETGRELPELRKTDLVELYSRLGEVKLANIRPDYAQVVREIRAQGVELSDRRAVHGLKLVAGAALLRESDEAGLCDLWPMMHIWNRPEDAELLQEVVGPRLEEAGVDYSSRVRKVGEIQDDLDLVLSRHTNLRSEAALGAYLGALGRLRSEVMAGHPEETTLREQIERAVQEALKRMEMI